jgi:hypothetical protein
MGGQGIVLERVRLVYVPSLQAMGALDRGTLKFCYLPVELRVQLFKLRTGLEHMDWKNERSLHRCRADQTRCVPIRGRASAAPASTRGSSRMRLYAGAA